jgi:thiol:disulfide interchange protein DsbD
MKIPALFAAGLPFVSPALADGARSGHAEAALVCATDSYQPGKPVPLGIVLKIDAGWHSYWINPGVGGMPLSVEWTLPDGWTAGELGQPVPKRFMTGDLPGFGYEGEAVYRVDLTPPADARGDAEVKVEVSWLTCSDDACVPGKVELALKLPAGDAAAGSGAKVVEEAGRKVPRPLAAADATVGEKDGRVVVTFTAPPELDFTGSQAFPATPEVMDAAAPVTLEKGEQGWTASAPKNEYASGPVTVCDLVFAGGKLPHPVLVSARTK